MTARISDEPVGGVVRRGVAEQVDGGDGFAELVAAVRAHRLAVGRAYSARSVRAEHVANLVLWSLVAEEPIGFLGDWVVPGVGVEVGLERPALLEDLE